MKGDPENVIAQFSKTESHSVFIYPTFLVGSHVLTALIGNIWTPLWVANSRWALGH
jgi:hypothetical protein